MGRKSLSRHLCDICGNYYASPSGLEIHKATHTGMKPYKCDICGKGFAIKGYLQNHEKLHTETPRFSCEICGKGFKVKKGLQVRLKYYSIYLFNWYLSFLFTYVTAHILLFQTRI